MTRDEMYQEFDRIVDEVGSATKNEGYEGFLRAVNQLEQAYLQDMHDRGSVTDLDAIKAAIVWAFKNEGLHDDFDNHELPAFVEGARWARKAISSSKK